MAIILLVSRGQGSGQVALPAVPASATVTVDARHPWVDSGLTVRKGERVSFQAEGTIQWGAKQGQVAGPEGHGAKAGKLGVGGLIGRVGYTGKPFRIGSTRTPLVMPRDGRLFLGINDFIFSDNAGAFTVTVFRPALTTSGSFGSGLKIPAVSNAAVLDAFARAFGFREAAMIPGQPDRVGLFQFDVHASAFHTEVVDLPITVDILVEPH
jgi:hypothetical protein